MAETREKTLLEAIEKLGIHLNDIQLQQLLTYYDMLVEKNKTTNLTRITDFDEAVSKHFADSLAIVKAIDLKSAGKLLDIGTGAGFPGVPIAVAYPQIQVTMIDSVRKKTDFVNETLAELNKLGSLTAQALHVRAEDLANTKENRESYDLCVSRAVANLSTLAEYCLPFVKVGGYFISYKSGNSDEEIKAAETAIARLGGTKTDIFDYSIDEMGRTLIKITKGKHTPKAYPRKAGIPSKNPIG